MKTRVALIGLGGVADRIHLPACQAVPEIEVAGGCDPNPESRQKMQQKFGVPAVFEGAEEMLAKTRPDAVIIGTPPKSHFDLCRMSMDAGADVFCEKPFMSTVEQADRIIEIAREKNRLLRINNQYRYMTIYAETKRRLLAGEFGRVHYIQCWQQMFHPPAQETNWRNQLTQYVLYEFATHALDLITFFFDDLPDAMNVYTPRCRPEFDADVVVSGILRFPDERLATISFNRISHAPEKYLEMRLDCEKASIRLSLGGVARLSVEWSKIAGRPIVKAGLVKGGQARVEQKGNSRKFASGREREFASATAEHLRVFVRERDARQRPLEAAHHAREILNMVFLGYDSARTGETAWRKKTPTLQPAARELAASSV